MLKPTLAIALLILLPAPLWAQETRPAASPTATLQAENRDGAMTVVQIRLLKADLARTSQENGKPFDPKSYVDFQAQTNVMLAGWLLCLTDDDKGQRAAESVAASRRALKLLAHDDLWRFRAQGLLIAGLLLASPPTPTDQIPKAPGQTELEIELTRLFSLVLQDSAAYNKLWEDESFAFAKEPGFKQNLQKSLALCEASLQDNLLGAPASLPTSLSGAAMAHAYRFIPASTPEESLQNLQKARAAWTATLTSLPPNTPAHQRETYQILAADAWMDGPAFTSDNPERRTRADLLAAASLMEQLLAGDTPQARPLTAGQAASRLHTSLGYLYDMEQNPSQKINLMKHQLAVAELVLKAIPKGPGQGHEHRVTHPAEVNSTTFHSLPQGNPNSAPSQLQITNHGPKISS